MPLISHPAMVKVRGFTRRLGLNNFLGKLLGVAGYEVLLQNEMRRAINEGDCVWDVGANIGWYTLQFAKWVGKGGHVIAFEPDAENAKVLHRAVYGLENVCVEVIALSNVGGYAKFLRGRDQLGATSMIVRETGAESQTVIIESGDTVLARNRTYFPNLVKIDVEGHELEVLEGMATTLKQANLRHLFIEVHFATLEMQGRHWVPLAIENLLVSNGFKLKWIDPSHLHAAR